MKWQHAGMFVFASALCGAPALATTPVLSGSYVYSARTFCQPTIALAYAQDHYSQTFVTGMTLTSPESSQFDAGLARFDLAAATVTYRETKDEGDNVLLHAKSGQQGQTIAQKKEKGSAGYSNTASTVTLNGATYTAVFGSMKKGKPAYFALIGLDSAGCSEAWEFRRK
jgi:hypothetical protein